MPLRIQVLGGMQAFRDDVPLAWVPAQPIRSALLLCLALEPETRREQLTRLLWPDEEPERARHAFRQNLYLLRQALGEDAIQQQNEVLRLGEPTQSDARDFEAAVERGDFALAVPLYHGAFLKEVILCESREFEAWVDRERAKYGRLYRRACRALIDDLAGRDRLSEAVETARSWVSLEPFEDEAQHRLIELLAARGQRSEALAQFALYEKLLAGEELEPLDETKALVGQLRGAEAGSVQALHTPLDVSRTPTLQAAVAPDPAVTPPVTEVTDPADAFGALARELRPELQLLRPLGAGRSGRVFLARESNLNRLVAVKVLAPELAGNWVALARFDREARAAAALSHPHAVTVYRFGYLSSGVPYLVMQYVKGGTLEDHMVGHGTSSIPEVRRVLAEIADALAAAHRSGFVHRDLRPANVLWDEASGRVLVSDFGLAGLLPEAQGAEAQLTEQGEVLSSPEYASPEQVRGGDVSEASDVYALGVLAYRLLTGEAPIEATGDLAPMAEQLLRPPRPLRSLRADVDQALAELVEKCLARDPLERPRAAFLAQAFRAPQPSLTSAEAHPSGGRLLARFKAHRLTYTVSVLVVVGLGLLAVSTC